MGTTPITVGSGDPNAGLNAPIGESTDSSTSLPLESTESTVTQTAEGEAEIDATTGLPKTPTEEAAGETREDGRLIPQWMRAMKESNPEGYKLAKGLLFGMKEYQSIYPTVQAARDEHELVESLGGHEGAATLREDANFFHDAANQFIKGDPAFVKDLWEEDPIAAALHVQPMLDEFRARDFDGFKSSIARIWVNDFKALNFAPALKDLAAAIASGNKEVAGQIANSIQKWHDSIMDVANRAEDPRVKTLLAERNKQRETRQQTEHQEFIKGYRTDAANAVVTEGNKVFDSFFRGRKLDAEDRTDLFRESVSLANRAVMADKAHMEQVNKHLESGDSASAIRLTKARFAREMNDAVKRVARRYGIVSGKAPTPQVTKPAGVQQITQPTQGFVAVTERPTADQIDQTATVSLAAKSGQTYADFIVGKKAVLRGGRKVDWSRVK